MAEIRTGRAALAAALAALSGCGLTSRDLEGVGVTPSAAYWRAEAKGDVQAGGPSPAGGKRDLDVDHDLGIDGEDLWTYRLDVEMGKHRVGGEYLPLQFSGGTGNPRDFVFHGQTYPAGDAISSELDLTTWVARWDYAISQDRRKADAVHVGIDAWWWRFDAQVKGSVSGNDERRSYTKLYPGVHTDTTLELSRGFTADINVAFAGVALDEFIYDLGASASYRLSDSIRLGAGYRWLRFDVDSGNDQVDLTVRGPYVLLALRF